MSPIIHATPTRRALAGARVALLLTIAAWAAYCVEQVWHLTHTTLGLRSLAEATVYLVIVTFLTGSASAYLLARLGCLQLVRGHRRTPRAVLEAAFDGAAPSMSVLVPSYREERAVIRQTLLSAALQEYPDLRVTLLIDDPAPSTRTQTRLLEDAREVPVEVADLLERPRRRAEAARATWAHNRALGTSRLDASLLCAEAYEEASEWFARRRDAERLSDHMDAFLVNEVLGRLADDCAATAAALRAAVDDGAPVSDERLRQLHDRLVWIFSAQVGSFERKRYANLSHEPNKAMNLNSYIGLQGSHYRERATANGVILLPVSDGPWDIDIPRTDYLLTLDADSMLMPEYCLRLVAFMEDAGNADVGVVQTPYSAFRGAPTRIERLAGATTDLQHLVHQGLSYYAATFWVGANAVIRRRALDDVVVDERHEGFVIHRFISDRTVIEDTESTLDLRVAGWRLVNYPERLSYSATPPDFGALCIQRQRWANGGLVILPRLWRLVRRGPGGRKDAPRGARLTEAFLRLNYLASIGWASVGLALLLLYPFDQGLLSRFAVMTAIPYFTAISTDLHRLGYRRTDVFRLYGLNIMLLAVNMWGTGKSLWQAITGQKNAFARTPKVKNRTIAPLPFVLVPVAITVWSTSTLIADILSGHYLHAVFAGINASTTLWALVALYGLHHAVVDVCIDVREWCHVGRAEPSVATAGPDWVQVLYHGTVVSGERAEGAAHAEVLAVMDQDEDAANELGVEVHGTDIRRRAKEASGGSAAPVADGTVAR